MYIQLVTEYDVTNISGTQPRKNVITMGKVDTFDLMMIITWTIDISFQSPILKWASWTHTTPYIAMLVIGGELIACLRIHHIIDIWSSKIWILQHAGSNRHYISKHSCSFWVPCFDISINMSNIPFSETMMIRLSTHICVVNTCRAGCRGQ